MKSKHSLFLCLFIFLPIVPSTVNAQADFAELCKAKNGISVSAVGDVMIDGISGGAWKHDDLLAFLAKAKPYFESSDISFANLEGPIGGNPREAKRCSSPHCFTFSQNPSTARALRESGVSLVSVANNHRMDMGPSGAANTAMALDLARIEWSGTPEKPSVFFKSKGLRVAMVSFGSNKFNPDWRDEKLALAAISEAKSKSDVLIVSAHAGCEGAKHSAIPDSDESCFGENRGNFLRFARDAVDFGADLVIGHGPHVPRAMETRNGRLIAFSLGNFATGPGISVAGPAGLAPMLFACLSTANGSLLDHKVVSFSQTRGAKAIERDFGETAGLVISNLSASLFTEEQRKNRLFAKGQPESVGTKTSGGGPLRP